MAQRIRSQNLPQRLFQADVPEREIRKYSAQSVFLAIQHNGITSSADVIAICSSQQLRLILDFDLWTTSRFSEEQFWEWLSLGDLEDGLDLLIKVLKSVDLKLVGLLITKHVACIVQEEPSDVPPEKGFFTPDKGSTWLQVRIENELHHFYFSRFLAVIFETNPEVFYQLISIPSVSTPSMLEEESFQERTSRLSEQGIPDSELAAQYQSPVIPSQIKNEIEERESIEGSLVGDNPTVQPLVYDQGLSRCLEKLASQPETRELFEAELTLIVNTALVHWNISPHETTPYALLCDQVKGACEIGLEFMTAEGLDKTRGRS